MAGTLRETGDGGVKKTALILSGGGARAAYQVGVLKAVAELVPPSCRSPFPVVCGTSAGAINAVSVASHAGEFHAGIEYLERMWLSLSAGMVYRTDFQGAVRSALRLFASLFNRGIGTAQPIALLDNTPLRRLLHQTVAFEKIQSAIDRGFLDAISVTAMGYTSGESVSFFQGRDDLPGWRRSRRVGVRSRVRLEHLMASSAIPTLFPAVRINREFFGDGALRQVSPISPALHLGAQRVFVIGVSGNLRRGAERPVVEHSPSIAQIVGHLLASAFIDSLEGDVELLQRFNRMIEAMPAQGEGSSAQMGLKPVDILVISPSEAIDKIAGRHVADLPKTMRYFLGATGGTARAGGASAASYLLFERPFCQELIDLGYRDAMEQADAIRAFLSVSEDEVDRTTHA